MKNKNLSENTERQTSPHSRGEWPSLEGAERIALEDLFAPLDEIDKQLDGYRRAYKYLIDQMICCQGQVSPEEEIWQWMEDDIKNARAIAGEQDER